MKETTRPIFNKLVISGIIVIAILLMQPLEVWLFFKDIVILFPKGLIALEQRNLLLLIQVLMLLFIIPIYLLTFIFSWWYRADNEKSQYDPHLVDHKIAEIVWWGLPFVMTLLVCIITYFKTHELDPYKPIPSEKKALEIEAVALQWRWLFIYPEEKIATVNFVQFPENARFMVQDRFKLKAHRQAYEFYCRMIPKCTQAMLDEPIWDILPDIRIPTQVVYGLADKLIPNPILHPSLTLEEVAWAGTRRIPGAHLSLIPGGGHFVHWEQPILVNEVLRPLVR